MRAASFRREPVSRTLRASGTLCGSQFRQLWSAVLTLVAASLTLRVGVFSTRSTGGLRLVAVEFVVERLQCDAEFDGGLGLVALMLVQHAIDHVHFDLAKCLRM